MQEDQAYSKPVVLDSLYPMISRLIRHVQGQTLAEFWSTQATWVDRKSFFNRKSFLKTILGLYIID